MLLLSPVSAAITNRVGPKVTLALGAAIVAVGFLARIGLDGQLWEIIVGTGIAGAGTGIAYAAMPALIGRAAAPRSELAAANGLNTLCRAVGSSLATAIGGTLFAAQLVFGAGRAFPSHGAYRLLFALCAGAEPDARASGDVPAVSAEPAEPAEPAVERLGRSCSSSARVRLLKPV